MASEYDVCTGERLVNTLASAMCGFAFIETSKLAASLIHRILQNGTALGVERHPPSAL